MILFDTTSYGHPVLSKFEGLKPELNPSQGTYRSFNKAKCIVVKSLEQKIESLKDELNTVKNINSENDLEFSENPFTGYLRSEHGELK